MATYLHPGVYVEEIPSGANPIEGVATSTAVFVGATPRGTIGQPVLITSWDQYEDAYDGIRDTASDEPIDHMGYSAWAFFRNGGKKAYVLRLSGGGATVAEGYLFHPEDATLLIRFQAVNEGRWGGRLRVTMYSAAVGDETRYELAVELRDAYSDAAEPTGDNVQEERFTDLALDEDDPEFLPVRLQDSLLIRASIIDAADVAAAQMGTSTSGDLSELVPTTLNNAQLTLSLDGGAAFIVSFAMDEFDGDSTFDDVAAAIQDKVHDGAAAGTSRAGFTAQASGTTLVLASGITGTASAVAASGAAGSAADTLHLGAAYGGTELTGQGVLQALVHAQEHLRGVSISGDLTGLNPTTLNSTRLTLGLDGAASFNVDFDPTEFVADATLDDVAEVIQTKVRAGAGLARTAFTAAAVGSTLELTSGTRTPASSVAAGDVAAQRLHLGEANGGEELTGAQTAQLELADEGAATALTPGSDGDPPGQDEYDDGFATLRKFSVNILCVPGQVWGQGGEGAVGSAEAYAKSMRTSMFLVDPPTGGPDAELVDAADVAGLELTTSTYGVLYYPWLEVSNPHYDAEKRPDRSKTVLVPPCGFAAGMWAKIDGSRGVWKAPAGTETSLNGAIGAEFIVGDDEQDGLNPLGVNCIRKLNVAGLSSRVIWGTRTLATKSKPEWRYVPVRRTAIYIEQSIYNGIHWAVFEPNDHRLWSSLRASIDSFMNGLFRAGAFQGEKASSAYFVRCGLGDTMTQGDIDAGQVIVIVGFAPVKPAEFVIIRIQQKVGEQ